MTWENQETNKEAEFIVTRAGIYPVAPYSCQQQCLTTGQPTALPSIKLN
jgi:hypothetical protein